MEMDDAQSLAMLNEASRRASALVDGLRRHQRELGEHPSELPARQLARGRQAVENALASAGRLLGSLDEAIRTASTSSNQ